MEEPEDVTARYPFSLRGLPPGERVWEFLRGIALLVILAALAGTFAGSVVGAFAAVVWAVAGR